MILEYYTIYYFVSLFDTILQETEGGGTYLCIPIEKEFNGKDSRKDMYYLAIQVKWACINSYGRIPVPVIENQKLGDAVFFVNNYMFSH